MTVELDDSDARMCAYLLGALARERRRAGHPVPSDVEALQRRLEHQIVTRSRQSGRTDRRESGAFDRVGTKWVAQRLGWSKSTVLRNASELEGEVIGGAYMYPRATVERVATQLGGIEPCKVNHATGCH